MDLLSMYAAIPRLTLDNILMPSIRPLHQDTLRFRAARHGDGAALWDLVRAAGTLELNSAYFYLLFASDFGDTCLIAEHDGKVAGAVIGYRPPASPECAFVWQIGVARTLQGKGLGKRLLREWLNLPANADATWLTATVAEDNRPSDRLFRSFARDLGVRCETTPRFTAELFPQAHPAEHLYRIGPLAHEPAEPTPTN